MQRPVPEAVGTQEWERLDFFISRSGRELLGMLSWTAPDGEPRVSQALTHTRDVCTATASTLTRPAPLGVLTPHSLTKGPTASLGPRAGFYKARGVQLERNWLHKGRKYPSFSHL